MLQATSCTAGLPLLNIGRQYYASGVNHQTPAATETACWHYQLEGPSTSGTMRLEADSSSLVQGQMCVRVRVSERDPWNHFWVNQKFSMRLSSDIISHRQLISAILKSLTNGTRASSFDEHLINTNFMKYHTSLAFSSKIYMAKGHNGYCRPSREPRNTDWWAMAWRPMF